MDYTIIEHKHRFAVWAAGRAASVTGCRFKVETGRKIIEGSKLAEVAKGIQSLPEPDEFDTYHRKMRQRVIDSAEDINLKFTHGVAAKLINIYLKSIFVCGDNYDNPRVKAIHPPIDSLLLDELYNRNIGNQKPEWQKARKARWSKLTFDEYENVISAIQKAVPANEGLWRIEEYWQGYK